MKYLAIIMCLCIAACAATTAEQHAAFDPWIGRSLDDLMTRWGTPSNVYQMPGDKFTVYTWLYEGGTQVVASSWSSGERAWVTGNAERNYCRVDWTADTQGHITSWRSEGRCSVTSPVITGGHIDSHPVGKYAYVDADKIVNDCKAGKKAKLILERVMREKTAVLNNKKQYIAELKSMDRAHDLEKNSKEYEQLLKESKDEVRSIETKFNDFMMTQIKREMKELYEKEKKYSGLFYLTKGTDVLTDLWVGTKRGVVYQKNADDITQQLINNLDGKEQVADAIIDEYPYVKTP